MKSFESIAQAAYETFRAQLHHAYPDDRPVLPWGELRAETRQAWISAAQTMADLIMQVH